MFKARVQFWRRIDRLIGFESDNEIAAKFSRERIKSVRNTIHIYYLTIIAPFIGIAWVTWDQTPTRIMAGILVLAVITRFRHWVLPLPEGASEDVNPVAARVTGFMVVLLSCSQTLFYLSLAFGSIAFNNENMAWLQILSLALLAGLTQGAALTGIVFASRVIFFCFVLPLVAAVLYIYAGNNLPASVAVIVLTVVSLYLAETSHKMQLSLLKAQFDADAALTVVMAAEGYPGTPQRGGTIQGIDAAERDGAIVFQAGTAMAGDTLVADGGRVLAVTATGPDIGAARTAAYAAVDRIDFPTGFFRRDIGAKASAEC